MFVGGTLFHKEIINNEVLVVFRMVAIKWNISPPTIRSFTLRAAHFEGKTGAIDFFI